MASTTSQMAHSNVSPRILEHAPKSDLSDYPDDLSECSTLAKQYTYQPVATKSGSEVTGKDVLRDETPPTPPGTQETVVAASPQPMTPPPTTGLVTFPSPSLQETGSKQHASTPPSFSRRLKARNIDLLDVSTPSTLRRSTRIRRPPNNFPGMVPPASSSGLKPEVKSKIVALKLTSGMRMALVDKDFTLLEEPDLQTPTKRKRALRDVKPFPRKRSPRTKAQSLVGSEMKMETASSFDDSSAPGSSDQFAQAQNDTVLLSHSQIATSEAIEGSPIGFVPPDDTLWSIASQLMNFRTVPGPSPEPSSQPIVWAQKRFDLCETLPYFRQHKGGYQGNDNHARGFLLAGTPFKRDYIDGSVFISRASGGMVLDKATGRRGLAKDQKKGKPTQSLRNSMKRYNPVVLITSASNPLMPSRVPHPHCVLDHFMPTHIWWEKKKDNNSEVRFLRYRFERLNPKEETAWWQPKGTQEIARPGSLQPPVIPLALADPYRPITDSYMPTRDYVSKRIRVSEPIWAYNYRIDRYTIPGINSFIVHMVANETINQEPGGPNDMFEELQRVDIGLERRILGSENHKDPSYTRHMNVNFGAPYKFVASGAARSFEDSEADSIPHARSRLNWAMQLVRGLQHGKTNKEVSQDLKAKEFNEVLALGYFEDQKINYHDDGEPGVGPSIATLSLGDTGIMRIRMKPTHYHGVSKAGIYDYKFDPVLGSKKYKERFAKHTEILRNAPKTGHDAYMKAVAKDLGLKLGPAPIDDMILVLGHGDIVIMDGALLQTLFEHSVSHAGRHPRFALTARYIDLDSLASKDRPHFEVGQDMGNYDGSKLSLPKDYMGLPIENSWKFVDMELEHGSEASEKEEPDADDVDYDDDD
ncbi:hypothetical protein N0V90_004903 [Kalmusia sp. IMI 367209]|nr:hypothetical protein N0V90_004903 [Kalmusia sp. IMI 367209]